MPRLSLVLFAFPLILIACPPAKDSASGDDTGAAGPLDFTAVATEGAPLDATPSADGAVIYFVGASGGMPAVFRVGDGAPTVLLSGDPLVAPQGLSLSPDDQTLYVADPGASGGGAVLVLSADGAVQDTVAVGLAPRGVHATASGVIFTGLAEDGQPGVFEGVGGTVTALATGAPLVDPDAVVQASDGAVYVTDTPRSPGEGQVIAVSAGAASALATGLSLADPAGLSITTDDSTLVVSAINADSGQDEVLLMDRTTGAFSATSAGIEGNTEGGGVHRAADQNIWAWADLSAGSGGTVYRVNLH